MPVSTESSISGPFTPNGATTDFAFDFKATNADEVVALDQDGATISTALYSVTLDSDEGGTLSFSAVPTLAQYSSIYIASNGFQRAITFMWDGTKAVELYRSTGDVAN